MKHPKWIVKNSLRNGESSIVVPYKIALNIIYMHNLLMVINEQRPNGYFNLFGDGKE